MPMYSFRCECGWEDDRRTGWDAESVLCPGCGSEAKRQSVYRIAVSGLAATPLSQRTYYQEFKDFKEASAELEYKHMRAEEAVGKTLQPPPLATIAKAEARRLLKLGVKDSADWQARQRH